MIDRVCFGMPEDRQDAMVALPVVQDYVMQIKRQIERGQRPSSKYEVWVHWPDPGMVWAHGLLWDAQFLGEYAPVRGEWDYAHKFDLKTAYELSIPTKRPAVETLAILAGASPPLDTPILKGVPELEGIGGGAPGSIAVLWGPEQQAVVELLELHYPEMNVWEVPESVWDVDRVGFSLREAVQSVRNASLVIGRRSWQTAIIAGMDKFLLEFYPDDVHEKWFSKWSGKKYQMIYGKEFPKEVVWAGLEAIWDRWTSFTLRASTVG